jgi:hypothetical protein
MELRKIARILGINKRYIFTFIIEKLNICKRYYDFYIEKNTHSSLFYVIQDNFQLKNVNQVFCDCNISYYKYFGYKATF